MKKLNARVSAWLLRKVTGMQRYYVWASLYSLNSLRMVLFVLALLGFLGLWRSGFTSKVLWAQVGISLALWLLARSHFWLVLDQTKGLRSLTAAYRCWDFSLIPLALFIVVHHFFYGA